MRLTVVLALVCMLAGSSYAEDKNKARAAYRDGTQHYDLGEYNDALLSFKEAYRNFEEPTFLFNIGQCYRQFGDKPQALRFYRTYLIKVPRASNRTEVLDMIARLQNMGGGAVSRLVRN